MALGADAEDRNDMAEMIAEDDLRFLDGDNVDTVTRDLLRKLLAKNAKDRLTVEEIKAHPYFNGM
jgi:serine/threonine protein kinase